MTVIAIKNGVIAADTGLWLGNICVEHCKKIRRLSDGRLFAISGHRAIGEACYAWLQDESLRPEPGSDDSDFGGLLLTKDGAFRVDYKFRIYPTGIPAAAGSHTEFLMGAMYAGASAEEAVRLAIKHGDSAAGEVQVEYL